MSADSLIGIRAHFTWLESQGEFVDQLVNDLRTVATEVSEASVPDAPGGALPQYADRQIQILAEPDEAELALAMLVGIVVYGPSVMIRMELAPTWPKPRAPRNNKIPTVEDVEKRLKVKP